MLFFFVTSNWKRHADVNDGKHPSTAYKSCLQYKTILKRPFPSSPGPLFKMRVGGQPLIWKSIFILMQIKLIFTRKVVPLASFWKWGFLELGSGIFGGRFWTEEREGVKLTPHRYLTTAAVFKWMRADFSVACSRRSVGRELNCRRWAIKEHDRKSKKDYRQLVGTMFRK